MRPYLAVIKDSFREAFATKMLWILLALISLLLIGLAGLSLEARQTLTLTSTDFIDPLGFINVLVESGEIDQPTPARLIWNRLPGDLQKDLRQIASKESPQLITSAIRQLRQEINAQLKSKDFFDPEVFSQEKLSHEARQLQKRGVDSLSLKERLQFHRLLLQSEFPFFIAPVGRGAVYFSYYGLASNDPVPGMQPDDIDEIVNNVALAIMTYLVRMLGVFIAILVTASIVPRMFAAGEVDLLFSKPVSRSLLFLSKFVGGCAFALMLTTYFVTGVWLIAGLRFGIWNHNMLMAIPVFLFVFAVYYSVSAAAGVIYRSTILAIGMAILFWFVCFVVGTAHDFILNLSLNGQRAQEILPMGDDLIVTVKTGETKLWNPESESWEPIFAAQDHALPPSMAGLGFFYPMVGPIPLDDQIVAIEKNFAGPNFSTLGNLLIGSKTEGWIQQRGIAAPGGTVQIKAHPSLGLLASGPSGIYQLQGNLSEKPRPAKVFGFKLPIETAETHFEKISPRSFRLWNSPVHCAVNSSDGRIAVLEAGNLHLLRVKEDGQLEILSTKKDVIEKSGLIGFSPQSIIIAEESGNIHLLDPHSLKKKKTILPYQEMEPRRIRVSLDGKRFLVLYHERHLFVGNSEDGSNSGISFRGQGEITAACFAPDNTIYVSDRFPRITQYDLTSGQQGRSWESNDTLAKIYLYGVRFLHAIFPIPSELDAVTGYLLTGEDTQPLNRSADLTQERVVVDVWSPLWRNLVFLSVILGLTCLYILRKDF